MKKQNFLAFVLLLILALPFASCKKEEKNPPALPPQSGFIMDNSDFQDGKKSGELCIGNWGWAALNVAVWNTILTVNLAVPVASFKEAMEHTPVYNNDTQSWVWSYTVQVGNVTYFAELHGKYVSEGVRWDMYISKEGSYTDFLWYYGVSNSAGNEGYWMLKNSPELNQDYIKITWHKTSDQVADIKYENVLEGTAEKGTYIVQKIYVADDFDASYDIYTATNSNLTEIKWHRTNENGRVKDAAHFGDAVWHCWDANHIDTMCP